MKHDLAPRSRTPKRVPHPRKSTKPSLLALLLVLLLRSDVYRLFDAGYITVTPEHRVEASQRMREDFNDGENYMKLHGSGILVPREQEFRPDPEALRWHNENRFRG